MNWKDKFNKKYMQISLYVILTTVIIAILVLIVFNAPVIFYKIMDIVNWIVSVIKPIIIGFIFAYLMDPVVSFFEKKLIQLKKFKLFRKFKAPRTWAAVISTALLIIVVVGLISLLVFSVTNQLRLANFDDIIQLFKNFADSMTGFFNSIQDKLKELDVESGQFEQYITDATTQLINLLKNFANSIVDSITNFSGYLTTFIFSLIIGFYFLIDGRMFTTYVKKVFRALFSDNANKRISGIVHDMDAVFSGYIRGQLTDAFVMMILISLVLSVTGVKFALVIGIFAGIGNLIPYFGPIVAYISTTVVCLINGDIKILIVSLIALFIIQAIDGNFIGPKLLSRSIKIHPLIIIVSLIFGSALGGFLGMLLAVPVGAYCKLIFVRFIERRIEHREVQKRQEQTFSGKS
jgi:predicted PurR-regulated permease PerM